MKISLSEHFNFKKLMRFVLPSIIMMIFTSIYSVVDGIFVSNFVGTTSFAAINLIMPPLMIFGAVGFMIGAGGSAIVARTLGEGDIGRANEYFSMLIYFIAATGILLTAVGFFVIKPIAEVLGARGQMLDDCVLYGRILLLCLTPFMLQSAFQSFFVAAEKAKLGLAFTIAAGLANIILDAVFILACKWGLLGAALATGISQCAGGILPLIYFCRKNGSLLRLTKAKPNLKILLKACTNGSSELMTNISMSVVNILYNYQLMRLAGENGVAAYGFIMYVSFIFAAIFIGYSIGSAPIISYHYGAENQAELKNLFKKSILFVSAGGILLTALAIGLATPLSELFVGYDRALFELTRHGFRIYAVSFLLIGFNIFGSAFFTALNNGLISAVISFLRTLLFQTGTILVLPLILGLDGVWIAVIAAEFLAAAVTAVFFIAKRKQFNYA